MNNNHLSAAPLRRLTILLFITAATFIAALSPSSRVQADTETTFPHRQGTLYTPYLEWSLTNPSYSGNPFDLIATVTFTHASSTETRTTGMFFDGNDTWRFRFAGTRTGDWSFVTSSSDGDLDGHTGTLTIADDPDARGFVSHLNNRWVWSATGQAFVPQFVMASGPHNYDNNPGRVDAEIQTFLVDHGFSGFHSPVFCRWFDINEPNCANIGSPSPNPDLRTFAALELLITKTYAAGGSVHLWLWGDDARQQNPNSLPGGINGPVDQRLQRYIAARLGPLPGWTAGYGFDLWEWVSGSQLTQWHDDMQAYLGWPHLLGARARKNELTQLSEAMDYASYEQHRPDYNLYVQTIDTRPQKPSFSADRFRVRNENRPKDYTEEMTRRGLWHSTMAGGVANIWGNLWNDTAANDGSDTSLPYNHPEWIRTYADFWNERFFTDMERCNGLTNHYCLKRPHPPFYVFYAEDTSAITLDLSGMPAATNATAVDTTLAYAEIPLGTLNPVNQTWSAPYQSDWAIVVSGEPVSFGVNLYLPLVLHN